MTAAEETLLLTPQVDIIFFCFLPEKKKMNKNKNTNLLLTTFREREMKINKYIVNGIDLKMDTLHNKYHFPSITLDFLRSWGEIDKLLRQHLVTELDRQATSLKGLLIKS